MYRAVTWKMLQEEIAPEQSDKIAELAGRMRIELLPGEHGQRVLVDGRDVTDEIRSLAVNRLVGKVAQIPEVRRLLVQKQRQMAAAKGVVLDGRDIGTEVLPDAEVKIFLTASVKERAERRYHELARVGQTIPLEQLEKEIAERDRMDEQREISPLVQAPDAVLIDSTDKTIEQVVDEVLTLCRSRSGGGT
jgi:cytidylate kinase